MKILLTAVNAKYIHSNLAVYSLKASAGVYEPLVELAEYTINHQMDDIFCSIYQKKPDLLFLSCYIWNRREILEITQNIRKVLPDTIIWLGGPEVSYDSVELLRENPQIDGVMIGEGELTFRKLLAYYVDQKGSLDQISGIAYRSVSDKDCIEADSLQTAQLENNEPFSLNEPCRICWQAAAPPTSTLNELPFVYHRIEDFENRIIYYESSRGCPFSCSYCLSSIDKKVRFRDPELVEQELAFFLEHKVPQVKFVDRTFNCSHAHAQRIWKFIQEHDNGVTNFHFEIAADLLNEEEIELLSRMRPGLVQLEIGVQTVNEHTLEAINRTAKFEKITKRVKQVAEGRNIHQHLDLIAGLPFEDYESFRTSFDAVYALRPQELQLGFLKVLKGSEMYRRKEEYGIVYRSSQPYEVLATKWISCDELLRLKEVEEMLEVHYNSLQFVHTIQALEEWFDRPFDLYASLADYYKKEGLWGKSYSRMQRFEILRGFIGDMLSVKQTQEEKMTAVCGCKTAAETEWQRKRFDELLTLDFYLRENAKSRPEWSKDQSRYREQIAAFYQKEEQERSCLSGYEEMTWKQMMRMTHLERFECLQITDIDTATREDRTVSMNTAAREDRTVDMNTAVGTDQIVEDRTAVCQENAYWVLFDYKNRDPLTYDAGITVIDIEKLKQ